jgi:hypothetical protein
VTFSFVLKNKKNSFVPDEKKTYGYPVKEGLDGPTALGALGFLEVVVSLKSLERREDEPEGRRKGGKEEERRKGEKEKGKREGREERKGGKERKREGGSTYGGNSTNCRQICNRLSAWFSTNSGPARTQ